MSRKTFEIRQEREIYSLEIIKLLSGKKNSILIKTFNKKTTPKIIYTNNFSYNKLIELSKAFKTCDSISEIFNLISNNLENKSIKILYLIIIKILKYVLILIYQMGKQKKLN